MRFARLLCERRSPLRRTGTGRDEPLQINRVRHPLVTSTIWMQAISRPQGNCWVETRRDVCPFAYLKWQASKSSTESNAPTASYELVYCLAPDIDFGTTMHRSAVQAGGNSC